MAIGAFFILEFLLSQPYDPTSPKVYGVPQTNVTADFWHTGVEHDTVLGREDPGRYVPPPYTPGYMLRVYETFPGFAFVRLGRWEGVRHQTELLAKRVELQHPLWMQCNVKSTHNYLFRSERTNWRELGRFDKYPTLLSYVTEVIPKRYGTHDIDEAAERYFETNILPFLQLYDPVRHYPYPKLVVQQMSRNPVYQIIERNGALVRHFLGLGYLPVP